MTSIETLTWNIAIAVRWAARIGGILMVLFVLGFLVAEGPPPILTMTTRERLFGLGMAALFLGLVLSLFREGWGGILSVAGWCLLSAVSQRPMLTFPFAIPALLGVLHLVCWARLHDAVPAARKPSLSLWALLGLFVLLCANEMFGMPPLMTPPLKPGPDLFGTWTAAGVSFTIAADGSVSGFIGNVPLTRARITYNRSWFGQLMHWRTEYLIQGTAGARFTVPMNRRGSTLEATLFLAGKPQPGRLNLTRH